MTRFTHYQTEHDDTVNLLAGDITNCIHCGRLIFRDWTFIEDGEPETRSEPASAWGNIALGRSTLPSNALAADPGDRICDGCPRETR